jgi:general secretion pathway protein K
MNANRERGVVFVMTLVVLIALTIILSGVARLTQTQFRAQINRIDEIRARRNAEAGLARALALFSAQTTQAQPGVTGMQDDWALLGTHGTDRFLVNDGSFRVQIVDACAFVNLNTVSEDQLMRMPLTQEQIDSLLDWREPGRSPRPDGAKDEYYNALENPYNAKLGPLDTVDELLLIRGFTSKALYMPQDNVVSTATQVQGSQNAQPVLADLVTVASASRNIAPSGQTKLNVNTATQQQLTQRGLPGPLAQAIIQRRNTQGTFTDIGDVLRVPGVNNNTARTILDNLTTTGGTQLTGLINLNTASESVLNTVPNLTPDISAAIVAQQQTGFASVADLLNVPGYSMQLLQQTARYFSVQSQSFVVRCLGTAGRVQAAIEAWITVDQNGPRVVRIDPKDSSVWTTRWRWPADTAADIDLEVAQQ